MQSNGHSEAPEPANLSRNDVFDMSRRIAFILSKVERATGGGGHKLPLVDRLDNALLGAMHAPAAVEPKYYALLYRLRHGQKRLGA